MSSRFTAFGHRIERFGFTALGFCAAIGLLCLLKGSPVQAQAPGVNMTALYNQVQALQTTVNAQAMQITALKAQTKYISTGTDENGYPAMFITACNVWVQDGSGSTSDGGNPNPTGLGNLVIGYNELGQGNPNGDSRTGSHNLIVGIGNSYTSWGGVVFGNLNTVSGYLATVTAGVDGHASGMFSSISGGPWNQALGWSSSVSGGYNGTAFGAVGSVSGGLYSNATGIYSSVSGGYGNTATALWSSVSGGQSNTAGGNYATVTGGNQNTASGIASSVTGGYYNQALGTGDCVNGGQQNTANSGGASTVSGGYLNNALGGFASTVSGGGSITQSNLQGWSGGSYHTP